ncbi:MAG: hypothetical protein AAF623_01410 [Planctomycetota bacterium]
MTEIDIAEKEKGGTFVPLPWSRQSRTLASIAIVIYLAIVLLGPLSIPIGSKHLTVPLARTVAPIHQLLFLGHGYRFFGPDPGPSHLVNISGVQNDGTEISLRFPDPDRQWPRLLYHRWFMLSETLFRERTQIPTPAEQQQLEKDYEQQIQQLKEQGQDKLAQRLAREKVLERRNIEANRIRFESLARAITKTLAIDLNADRLEISIQERALPFPEEFQAGIRLDDPSLLSSPIVISDYRNNEVQIRYEAPIEEIASE